MNFHQQHESKCEVCGLGETEGVAVYSEFFKLNPESENSELSLTLCAIYRYFTRTVYDLIGMAFEHILEMNGAANLAGDNQFQSLRTNSFQLVTNMRSTTKGEQRVIDAGRKSKRKRLIGHHSTNDKVEYQLNRFVRKLGGSNGIR